MLTPRIPRPRLSYANVTATLALVIATSMGGAYAHGKIGSALIKDNAVKSRHIASGQVKTPDLGTGAVASGKIKGKAVTLGKLAPSARPATVIRYNYGSHNFGTQPELTIKLPGNWTQGMVNNSQWAFQVIVNNYVLTWASPFDQGYANVRYENGSAYVFFGTNSYAAQASGLRVIRTVPNQSRTAIKARVAAP